MRIPLAVPDLNEKIETFPFRKTSHHQFRNGNFSIIWFVHGAGPQALTFVISLPTAYQKNIVRIIKFQ